MNSTGQHPTEKREAAAITWGPVAAILATIGIYFLAQFIGSVLITFYTVGRGWSQAVADDWLTNSVTAQFFLVLAVEVVTLTLLYWFLKGRKANFRTLGLRRIKWGDLGWALIGYGIYLPLLIGILTGVERLVPRVDLEQKQQLGFDTITEPWQLALVFISLVILPPIVEEIMVRGFLYLGLKSRLPKNLAIIITSLIFAVAHLQLGSGAAPLWAAAIDTFVLSIILIYIRDVTNGLWAPIGLHMIKNGTAFLALFVFKLS